MQRTALHCITQCSAVCNFIIRKSHKLHRTTLHLLYILIYLFIFNIKYIINSLTTLVFKKKKSLITLASVNQESQPKIKKNQLNSLKLSPEQKEKISFGLSKKSPKFEKYTYFKLFKPHFIYCTAYVTAKMRCGAVMVLAKL